MRASVKLLAAILAFTPFFCYASHINIKQDDQPISSAYQFRSCYKLQFNKQGLSSDVEYTLMNGEGVLQQGTLNSAQPSILFCEHNVFENHMVINYHRDRYSEFATFNVNGIEQNSGSKTTNYSILFKNDTQKNIEQISKLNFKIEHEYKFIPDEQHISLPQAQHVMNFSITSGANIVSLDENANSLGRNVMISDKYTLSKDNVLSNDGVLPDRSAIIPDYAQYGYDLVSSNFRSIMFRPRILSSSELVTFHFNLDSNPFYLIEPTSKTDKNISLTLDYANHSGANSFVDSGFIVNTDYLSGDVNHSPFTVDNLNGSDYRCGAFDYNHNTRQISGYCVAMSSYGNTVSSYFTSYKFDLNTCKTNHLKFTDSTHLACVEPK